MNSERPLIARQLLAGRNRVRAIGRAEVVRRLQGAAAPCPPSLALTVWNGSVEDTGEGTEDRPGRGRVFRLPLGEIAARLERYAPTVHAKSTGLIVAHGVSRWLGSADVECIERGWLFCESDVDGGADLVPTLDAIGLAHIVQWRNGRPHAWLPLAMPLLPPDDATELCEWKARTYVPAFAWLLGVFSELAGVHCVEDSEGINHLGFDLGTSRLLQPCYPRCRREPSDPVPEMRWRDGAALDWHAALAATGFDPERAASEARVHVPGTADRAWFDALTHDGLVRFSLRNGKGWAVRCPWESSHSTRARDDRDTGTVLFADGTWFCSHATHGRKSNTDVFAMLSDGAQRIVIAGLEESARANPDAAFAPYVVEFASSASAEDVSAIAESLRRAGLDVAGWARTVLRHGRRAA